MRPPKPPRPRIGKAPVNLGSMKSGLKGGAKSKLVSSKPPPKMAPGKGY
jgi:hypothetical protein